MFLKTKDNIPQGVDFSTLGLTHLKTQGTVPCVFFGVSAALEGYFLKRMTWYERIISAIGGLLLIYPGIVTDIIGIALVGVVLVLQIITKRKTVKTA